MPDVTALRFILVTDDAGKETMEEYDALIAVEVSDPEADRGIDLHISPRTEDVVTCSLSAEETWALVRELARAASEMELEAAHATA